MAYRFCSSPMCSAGEAYISPHHFLGKRLDLLHSPRRALLEANAVQQLPQVDGVLPRHNVLGGSNLLATLGHDSLRNAAGRGVGG